MENYSLMKSLQDFKDHVMKKKWPGRPSHKSWGSHRILLSDQSLKRGGVDHPPSSSVSQIPSDNQHLCVRKNENKGGTKKLTIMTCCEY
jgi:hypothetical protein